MYIVPTWERIALLYVNFARMYLWRKMNNCRYRENIYVVLTFIRFIKYYYFLIGKAVMLWILGWPHKGRYTLFKQYICYNPRVCSDVVNYRCTGARIIIVIMLVYIERSYAKFMEKFRL